MNASNATPQQRLRRLKFYRLCAQVVGPALGLGIGLGGGPDLLAAAAPSARRPAAARSPARSARPAAAARLAADEQPAEEPTTPPAARAGRIGGAAARDFKGRPVEQVRIVGNEQVADAVIRNVIRTRPGDGFDPATVEEDYQRVFRLGKFSNVSARFEPTAEGVIVVFEVTEQRQIRGVRFRGNRSIDSATIRSVIDLGPGDPVDPFRISQARRAIEALYRERNYPLAHVTVPETLVDDAGEVAFEIVEGPNVRIRNIEFKGNRSFSDDRLKGQIRTNTHIFVFRRGRYDPDQVDSDVAALRRFYESKGFFDARVGRKLIWSPDQTELQINFVIDEGPRYVVESIAFEGNESLSDEELRSKLRLTEGRPYDNATLQRDIRQVVRAYGPFGYIYQPQTGDEDYLRVDARPVFRAEPGKVDLVYAVREGKPFRVGRIIVKGNHKSQDRLVLRELRFAPGELYDAGKVADAADRLRGTPYFGAVQVTPIGNDPTFRDLLVEVQEARTASFNVGAGVNSNGGIGGNITYRQRNFDIRNVPDSPRDIFSDRGFVGAGQDLLLSLEPGTRATNASIRFSEPYLFDLPYSFTGELYLRDRVREDYDDSRVGGRVSFGKRFDYDNSMLLTLRGEQVEISDIEDEPLRATEILEEEGSHFLTSVGLQYRRDTTDPGVLPTRGSVFVVAGEWFGAMGGDYDFQKISLGYDAYRTVKEDLLDRPTVLGFHANAGYIFGDSVFFERFYGGGIGSIRGFKFRGVSPRDGRDDDPIGGDFALTGSVELNFPVVGENIRGVTFVDAGMVEQDLEIGTIRTSLGAGVRIILPFFGQAPLAIDFAVPVTKDDEDDEQLISFSFGFTQ